MAGLLICSRLAAAQEGHPGGSDTLAARDAASHRSITPTGDVQLDALIAEALERSPLTSAAADRIAAARARIRPAGTRADPSITAGLIQIPVRKPSLVDDNFTMLMAGITQNFPYPGKLALRTRAAELDAVAARTRSWRA